MPGKDVCVALDWTPNTNHTGFFVAKAKGWYEEAGLQVSLISPHADEYKATPLSRVADKTATFAITPSESVISYHTWPEEGVKPKVVAVATLLQSSTSAIVTLASSGITRPAQLDGKVYASYGARYEGRIVQQLIRNDGGKGDYTETTPPMLGIWDTLMQGKADATWVFLGWEGVEAEMRGVKLNTFKLEDYKVPYGYSPILVTHPDTLAQDSETVRAFLAATARGFQYAAQHPAESAGLLLQEANALVQACGKSLPQTLDLAMLQKAQAYTSAHYLSPHGQWGRMDKDVWGAFVQWLSDTGLLSSKVQSRQLGQSEHTTSLDGLRQGDVGERLDPLSLRDFFTNDYLP